MLILYKQVESSSQTLLGSLLFNCAWTYGGPNILQAVLIFQKTKFQGIHIFQLLHEILVPGGPLGGGVYCDRPSGSVFAYCKRSKTGATEGLGTRLATVIMSNIRMATTCISCDQLDFQTSESTCNIQLFPSSRPVQLTQHCDAVYSLQTYKKKTTAVVIYYHDQRLVNAQLQNLKFSEIFTCKMRCGRCYLCSA